MSHWKHYWPTAPGVPSATRSAPGTPRHYGSPPVSPPCASNSRPESPNRHRWSSPPHSRYSRTYPTYTRQSTPALASLAADDVAEQLSDLVFDGFIGATPMAHLVEIPRYLDAAAHRLEVPRPPPTVTERRPPQSTASWSGGNQRIQQLPETRREAFNEYAHWMVEELRVGLYAQRLRTAYPVSEKRVVRAFDTFT